MSRIAFVYSARLSRCSPGAGRCVSAWRSSSFSSQAASPLSVRGIGTPRVGGRHQAGANLADHLLPNLRMLSDFAEIQIIKRQPDGRIQLGCPGAKAVTSIAVLVQNSALRGGTGGARRRRGGRGLWTRRSRGLRQGPSSRWSDEPSQTQNAYTTSKNLFRLQSIPPRVLKSIAPHNLRHKHRQLGPRRRLSTPVTSFAHPARSFQTCTSANVNDPPTFASRKCKLIKKTADKDGSGCWNSREKFGLGGAYRGPWFWLV